jgi:hypothetical protein
MGWFDKSPQNRRKVIRFRYTVRKAGRKEMPFSGPSWRILDPQTLSYSYLVNLKGFYIDRNLK